MMSYFMKRLFHMQGMIVMLSLIALTSLPLALSRLVRDASMSLLLPITLLGALLSLVLVSLNARKLSSAIILLAFGPIALFVRIGQMGASLFEIIKQSVNLVFNWLYFHIPMNFHLLLSAGDDLTQRTFTLAGRLFFWFTSFWHGMPVDDPAVRTLIWSLGLWLIATWAGWQIFRNKRLLAGLLPSTIILAFVLDYTGKENGILWFHLALLLFLYGLTTYANLQERWKTFHIDYAESTGQDTLAFVGAVTVALVMFSYLSSTISINEILDNLREKRRVSNTTHFESLGLEPVEDQHTVTGFEGGLPRSHLIKSGPELSHQLVMTVSTGDLPPMPESAHPSVPRYYWRTFTYQIYTGSGWNNPPTFLEKIPSGQPLFESTVSKYQIVTQEVTFPDKTGGRLYWTGTLLRANVPFEAAWIRKTETNPLFDPELLTALSDAKSYRAESLALKVNGQELRASPSVYPDWVRERYLALPEEVPERVLALARDLTASEPTPYDRALAIQNYLREFPYTLNVSAPPAGRDVADYFLFDLKQGYCDYYATTMGVLARAAGLPARLVVGYANGFYDFEQAHYIVTENYAHSWVEVYFANIGWVEFEPTAGQPAMVYEETSSRQPLDQPLTENQPLSGIFELISQRGLAIVWIPFIFMIALIIVWTGWDSLRIIQLAPTEVIRHLFRRLRRMTRPVIGIGSKDQTAHQFASALTARLTTLTTRTRLQNWISPSYNEIDQLTELYSRSLFTPSPVTHAEARNAFKIWSRLRWRLILANILGGKKM